MLKKNLAQKVGSSRNLYLLFFLLFNTFTWYYMVLLTMNRIAGTSDLGYVFRAVYFVGVVVSSILGSILSSHIKRVNLLCLWIILGVASPLLFALTGDSSTSHFSAILFLQGLSFGLGMPSCLAYFSDCTKIENRGYMSALVFSASNFGAFPIAIFLTVFDIATSSVVLAVWRALGLIVFALFKPEEEISIKRGKNHSFSSALHDRSLLMYVIPWFMFSLIDRFEKFILRDFFEPDFYQLMLTLGPVIASFAMFLGGFMCDKIGRKRVVIYGFVSLGVAYAIIGMAPLMLISWYFYLIIDSIAAGILWVIFLLILWGDLSQPGHGEKYYMIGSIPFFLTDVFSLPLAPFIESIPATSSFSLASFFLFLAVLPLIYAPETLPEKKIELRRLRGYIEQAKKVREKYLGKSGTSS